MSRSGDTVSAELGHFTVPLDRRRQTSDSLVLAYVRFPATTTNPGPPIVYLAGGPGTSGIGTARGTRFPLFMALRRFGDVIALDQRGTGMSTGPAEPECDITRAYPIGHGLYEAHLRHLSLTVARECATMWQDSGVNLSAWNTRESAADVVALAAALGVAQLRLWGTSYGTHLALATIRDHPALIRDAILAGVEGPDHTIKLPGLWQEQLQKLSALVAADSVLRREVPDLLGLIERVISRLRVEPARIQFIGKEGRDTVNSIVTAFEVQLETINRLRDPGTLVTIPFLFQQMDRGDFTSIASADRSVGGLEAMPEAMDAASGITSQRLFRFYREAESSFLGGGDDLSDAYMGDALGVAGLGDEFRGPLRSDIPVLFISGTLDGRTPVSNVLDLIGGFPNAQHLVLENAGHGDGLFLSSPEILVAMTRFLSGDRLTTSRIRIVPPSFSSGRPAPTLSQRELSEIPGAYVRSAGDVWRIVQHGVTRSFDANGTEVGHKTALFIRFRGNGFPLEPSDSGGFRIAFPGLDRYRLWLDRDAAGRTALLMAAPSGPVVRMPAARWDEIGFIEADRWLLAGPFSPPEGSCATTLSPEREQLAGRMRAVAPGTATAEGLTWRPGVGDDGFVAFEDTFGRTPIGAAGYALIEVHAPAATDAWLRIGSDDDVRVWLGNRLVHSFDGERNAWAAQDSVQVRFTAGTTPLLVKVCNRDSDWEFNFRLTDRTSRSLVEESGRGWIRLRR